MGHFFHEDQEEKMEERKQRRKCKRRTFDESCWAFDKLVKSTSTLKRKPKRVAKKKNLTNLQSDDLSLNVEKRKRKRLYPRLVWTNPNKEPRPLRYVQAMKFR